MAHRDLKPENILMESNDVENLNIKIADFGFSCLVDPEKGLNQFLGTICYMAPEIISRKKYDLAVDVWSIGVVSFMLLSGKMLFNSFSTAKTKEKILNMPVSERIEGLC